MNLSIADVCLVAIAVALWVAVVAGFIWVVRDIGRTLLATARELGDGAGRVSLASGQVASSSHGLSQGAGPLAAALGPA